MGFKMPMFSLPGDMYINKISAGVKPTHVVLLLASLINHQTVSPIIVQGPSDTTTLLNGSTFFNCSTSMRNVTWYHYPVDGEGQRNDVYDEGRILTNYRNRFNIDTDFSSVSFNLLAKNLELKDAGRYECVDDVHQGKGASAELTVLGSDLICESDVKPGEDVGPSQCNRAILPAELQMSCSVTYNGNNVPQMQWRKFGVSSNSNETSCFNNDNRVTCHSTLTTNFQLSGSVYYCELDKQQYSCSLEFPKISYVFGGNATVNIAMVEEAICSANSSQSCNYIWKWFSGSDSLTVSTDQTLKPTRVGSHRCEATCYIGNTSCTVDVMFAEVHSTEATTGLLWLWISIAFILLILITALVVVLCLKHKREKKERSISGEEGASKTDLPLLIDVSTKDHKPQPYEDCALNESSVATLDNNITFLKENIDAENQLLDCMVRKEAITLAQLNSIAAEPEPLERSTTLLDFIRRGKRWQFQMTIEALKASRQENIADVLLHGGIVLSVQSNADANLPTIGPAEKKIAHQLHEFLQGAQECKNGLEGNNCSAAYLYLKYNGLICARLKGGIVFCFHCTYLEQLKRLQTMLVTKEMEEIITLIYNEVISTTTSVKIEVIWDDAEFKAAESKLKARINSLHTDGSTSAGEIQFTPPDELSSLLNITDQGMVDKLAITKYFIDSGTSGAIYAPFRWKDKKCALKQIMFSREEITEAMEDNIHKKVDSFNDLELDHPRLVKFFEVWFSSPALYIVMEYAQGGSLDKILRPQNASSSSSPFPLEVVQNWALQIADGMRYLHCKNLVHRHLKPAHVLVMEMLDVWPKTLKIGSYTLIREHDHATVMSFKRTMGWMAPECINGEQFSMMSDVWSYGVTVWEILTRDVPYKEVKNEMDLVREATHKRLKLQIPDSCSEPLQKLLTDCWNYEVVRRPSFQVICDLLDSPEEIRV